MAFVVRPMTAADAEAVAGWRYPGVYKFYNMDEDPADLAELLDPVNWASLYRAVVSGGELVGFFSFAASEGVVELGLGLRPDLTGQGLGGSFLEAGLEYARGAYGATRFRLAVATFNERAIRLYEKAGFRRGAVVERQSNGGVYSFLEMEREA